ALDLDQFAAVVLAAVGTSLAAGTGVVADPTVAGTAFAIASSPAPAPLVGRAVVVAPGRLPRLRTVARTRIGIRVTVGVGVGVAAVVVVVDLRRGRGRSRRGGRRTQRRIRVAAVRGAVAIVAVVLG